MKAIKVMYGEDAILKELAVECRYIEYYLIAVAKYSICNDLNNVSVDVLQDYFQGAAKE